MHKKCTKCGEDKPLDAFSIRRDRLNGSGRQSRCEVCKAAAASERRRANPEKDKEYHRKHRASHLKEAREYRAERYKTDPQFRLADLLRRRLHNALKGNHKAGSAVRDLGCSIPDLQAYLEAQFKPGMTWKNCGRYGWHIDHIKPLVSFDLTDREQLLAACHYTNLQPLWAAENHSKGARIV